MRILIAEDEQVSRHLLENTLRSCGHQVVSVGDGAAAWEVLQQEDAPQMAILDWVMPRMEGVEVCRRARELDKTKLIHLILLTAKGDKNDIVAGLEAGANDYLTKPFDRVELRARVQTGERMVEMRLAMMAELAERKRTEEVLRSNEQRFRSLIENSSDAIALFRVDGTILYASPSTPQVLGYAPLEFVSMNALDIVHPEDRAFVNQRYKMAFKQPRVGMRVEARARHKDGRWLWLECTFTNLCDEPSIGAFVNNYHDISERKLAEQALRESEGQLRLAQKLESVGRLAGGIAHDFNNLLTVINGYSDLLLRGKCADESTLIKIGEIKKAGERASVLTRQLLAFSRRQVLQPKVLNLNSSVNNLSEMLQRLIGENIELGLLLKPGLGQVKADPGQIEQVLMNLVVNARDAMPDGGTLLIETANVELGANYGSERVAVQPGPYIMLTVTDSGHGMDPETQKQVFEPFFTTKEVGKGTGLGLSTAYGIVKQSGGYIWVCSEIGKGTTFTIYLPRVDEQMSMACEDATQTALPKGSGTILLVEDEPMVRNIARTTLEMSGYKVIEAANGREALHIVDQKQEPIDLVLTDVIMPQMGGRELAAHLSARLPATKILYMSGYTDDALMHHGVLETNIAFLEKPFTPDTLSHKVRDLLEQKDHLPLLTGLEAGGSHPVPL
jgi:PAS domain S-box-containing protein